MVSTILQKQTVVVHLLSLLIKVNLAKDRRFELVQFSYPQFLHLLVSRLIFWYIMTDFSIIF
jgi:hypothetical protein